MSAEQAADSWTLKPTPHELQQAVTTEHVAVFGGDGIQLEVSGATEHDELEIDWTTIELDEAEVSSILRGSMYAEQCEDVAGRAYKLYVRGGERDPKGAPVHTNGEDA